MPDLNRSVSRQTNFSSTWPINMVDPQELHSSRRQKVFGAMALLGCVLCWGVVPVILRQLTGSINAWSANGIRYPLAAVCYWPVLWFAWSNGKLDKDLLRLALIPAVFAWLGQVFWGLAPYYLPASAIGFYVRFSMVPALTVAMFLFRDERRLLLVPRFYWGLALIVGGFLWFSLVQGSARLPGHWIGVSVMLACSLFFGLYGVSVRYFLRTKSPVLSFAVVAQYVSVGTFSTMVLWGDTQNIPLLDGSDWLRIAISTLLGISFGHIFMYVSIRALGAAITSSVQTLTPFVTVAMAALMLSEQMTRSQWFAGVTMVVGALVLVVTKPPKGDPSQEI